jgi:hypothetical protein
MAKHAIDLSFYQSGRINIASFSMTNELDAYRQIPEDYFPFLCLRVRAGGFVVSWLLPLSLLFTPANGCCAIVSQQYTATAKLIKLVIYH